MIVEMKAQIEAVQTHIEAQLDRLNPLVRKTVQYSSNNAILRERNENIVRRYLTSLLHKAVMIDKFVTSNVQHDIDSDPLAFARQYLPTLQNVPTSWLLVDPENGYTTSTTAEYTLNFYRARGYKVVPQYPART